MPVPLIELLSRAAEEEYETSHERLRPPGIVGKRIPRRPHAHVDPVGCATTLYLRDLIAHRDANVMAAIGLLPGEIRGAMPAPLFNEALIDVDVARAFFVDLSFLLKYRFRYEDDEQERERQASMRAWAKATNRDPANYYVWAASDLEGLAPNVGDPDIFVPGKKKPMVKIAMNQRYAKPLPLP